MGRIYGRGLRAAQAEQVDLTCMCNVICIEHVWRDITVLDPPTKIRLIRMRERMRLTQLRALSRMWTRAATLPPRAPPAADGGGCNAVHA